MCVKFDCYDFSRTLGQYINNDNLEDIVNATNITRSRLLIYLNGEASEPMFDWEIKSIAHALGLTNGKDSVDIDLLEVSGYDPFKEIECPRCNGSGNLLPPSIKVTDGEITLTCYHCNGSGNVLESIYKNF